MFLECIQGASLGRASHYPPNRLDHADATCGVFALSIAPGGRVSGRTYCERERRRRGPDRDLRQVTIFGSCRRRLAARCGRVRNHCGAVSGDIGRDLGCQCSSRACRGMSMFGSRGSEGIRFYCVVHLLFVGKSRRDRPRSSRHRRSHLIQSRDLRPCHTSRRILRSSPSSSICE